MRDLEKYYNDLYLYHKLKRCKSSFPKLGSDIHLHSKSGIYKVVNVYNRNVRITCNKWSVEVSNGERHVNYVDVHIDDVKCYKGNIGDGAIISILLH